MFQYRRPIERWSTLSHKIVAALSAFRNHPSDGIAEVSISRTFSLTIAKSEKAHETYFVFGGYSDYDSGGFIAAETIRNLAIVIPEKSRKITPFIHKYSEWWLVLLDHIGYARLEGHELEALRQHLPHHAMWAKIVLVNPLRPDHAVEV